MRNPLISVWNTSFIALSHHCSSLKFTSSLQIWCPLPCCQVDTTRWEVAFPRWLIWNGEEKGGSLQKDWDYFPLYPPWLSREFLGNIGRMKICRVLLYCTDAHILPAPWDSYQAAPLVHLLCTVSERIPAPPDFSGSHGFRLDLVIELCRKRKSILDLTQTCGALVFSPQSRVSGGD